MARHRKGGPNMVKVMIILTVLCFICGIIGAVYRTWSQSRDDDYDQRRPVPPPLSIRLVTLDSDQASAFLRHLETRGVRIDGFTADDTVRLGELACSTFNRSEAIPYTGVVDMIDGYTNNHLVSALVVDAAVTHICEGIDL